MHEEVTMQEGMKSGIPWTSIRCSLVGPFQEEYSIAHILCAFREDESEWSVSGGNRRMLG